MVLLKRIFCDDVSCYCIDIAWKTDEVAPSHNSFTLRFVLLGSIFTINLSVCVIILRMCCYLSCSREQIMPVPFTLSPTLCFVFIMFDKFSVFN